MAAFVAKQMVGNKLSAVKGKICSQITLRLCNKESSKALHES